MAAALTGAERQALLAQLPEWREAAGRDAIARSLRFRGFQEAFAFMTAVALEAERLDHHPEWTNVWNRVDVTLTTHDAGGVTARDAALAKRIDALAAQLASGPAPH